MPACGGKVRYCSESSDGATDCFTRPTNHDGNDEESAPGFGDSEDEGESTDGSTTGPGSTTGVIMGTGTSSTTGAVSTTDTTTTGAVTTDATTSTTSSATGDSGPSDDPYRPTYDDVDGLPCDVRQIPGEQAVVRCPFLAEFVEPTMTSSDVPLLVSVLNQAPYYSSGYCLGASYTLVFGYDSDGNGRFSWDEANATRTMCSEEGYIQNYYIYSQYDLNRLSGVDHYYGNLYVSGPDIYDLSPLKSLDQVDGYLAIVNTSVSDLDALQNLVYVGTGLQIGSNPNLQNLAGLTSLRQAGSIYLYDNDALSSLTGLDGIWSTSAVTLIDNDALTSLDGLGGLEILFGELYVDQNDALTNLRALANLNAVDGYVTFSYNFSLAPCEVEWLFYENSVSFGSSIYQVGNQGTGICP